MAIRGKIVRRVLKKPWLHEDLGCLSIREEEASVQAVFEGIT